MKIGKFSKENNLTIDTIRHYMELGLIIPDKKGAHYDFDERCKKDVYDILELKEMGFTLKEVTSLFLYKRLGKLSQYQEYECYKEFFINKKNQLEKEINNLSNSLEKLTKKIEKLSTVKYSENFKIGLDISIIDFFKCFKCGGNLVLKGSIENNQIINGELRCDCGKTYVIKNGILLINNELLSSDEKIQDDHIVGYINETSPKYLKKVYSSLEWIHKKVDFDDFKNKVILDLGSGSGFLLRYIYNDLPDNSVYIAVDHNIERHMFLKRMLEKVKVKKNIIFICADFLEMPLKEKVADIVIDYTGTSNYSFEHEDFLLKSVDKYIKEKVLIIGSYIIFKNFGANNIINKKFRKNFMLNNVKKELTKLNYKIKYEIMSDAIDEGGKFEDYFNEDEKVQPYLFYGKR
ncbi:MAG: MerR family transcriptional regulator [Firmicutes bacterium]|nr:MerR family transcriptional regulator [Bacillota bacterium]